MTRTRTHCINRHELTEDNVRLYVRKSGSRAGKTERRCVICYREKQPPYTRDRWLRQTYKITEADYDAMFEAQSGLCAVCRKPEVIKDAPLRVDHNHQTGQVRGLLCHHCNVALGHFKDNPALLRAAMEYLA